MKFATATSLIATSVFLASPALAGGTIDEPLPYTQIAPGATFNFTYSTRGDYCVSSYAFSVYVITQEPNTSFTDTDIFSGGYFFGRFDYENYPSDPSPVNPPPSQLTMPDFSQSQGGFGAIGRTASNQTFQLAVFEEYDGCETTGPLGRKISLATVPIIYNATGSV